jgi:hypothetical protein
MTRLLDDLRDLSRVGFPLWVDDHYRFVIVEGVQLPCGYNQQTIPVLIELPKRYPMTPPGVGGNRVYVPRKLRYRHSKIEDVHLGVGPWFKTPGWRSWAWLCYERIDWNPWRDNLITFIEMLRANLTNPKLA